MRLAGSLVVGSAALTVAACSYGYGVTRWGSADEVDNSCIETAIRETQGVEIIRAADDEQKSWGLDFKDTTIRSRSVLYKAPGIEMAAFTLTRQHDKQGVGAQHVWGAQNRKDITPETTRPAIDMMLRIERTIGVACGVNFGMQTRCSNIDCEPIEALVKEYSGA